MEKEKFEIVKKNGKSFYFIGVTTTKSSIMKLFPLWMQELGFPDLKIYPCDLKIHDSATNYRKAVAQIKYDDNSYGALVTTHKMDLFSATKDMFDYFDPYATLLHEVSCISKNAGRLEGHAKDPITSGAAYDHFVRDGYYKSNNAQVLIFGAGGSSIATILHLISKKNKADRPKKIIVVNRSQKRLEHLKKIVRQLKTDIVFDYICNEDSEKNDKIMSELPPESIVINATGMGKDTPGSPVTDNGIFPENGWAWEFNYRGKLDFMHQANAQVRTRNLKVEDGWIYFIHGWTQVIFQALHLKMTPEIFERFKKIADLKR